VGDFTCLNDAIGTATEEGARPRPIEGRCRDCNYQDPWQLELLRWADPTPKKSETPALTGASQHNFNPTSRSKAHGSTSFYNRRGQDRQSR
jgi:hypothetical protein